MTDNHIPSGAMCAARNYSSLNEAFELAAKIASARGEQYRALAYRRAIISPETVGSDLSGKIAEYKATGHIHDLDVLLSLPETRASLELSKILGFGPSTIRTLIGKGITSRESLIDNVKHQKITLTRMQNLGLQYFDDLQRKIPRDDVSRISEIVFTKIFESANEIFDSPETARQLLVETTGSYRRHARESNDIDILVAGPDGAHSRRQRGDLGHVLLHKVHERMSDLPGFIDIITLGNQKYSFLFRYHWVVSIDIIYVPRSSYFAALIYFTGSRSFNIWMRDQCKKRGYSLNQYGLTKIDAPPAEEIAEEASESPRDPERAIIRLDSEKHIFDILAIPYIPPANRDNPPSR